MPNLKAIAATAVGIASCASTIPAITGVLGAMGFTAGGIAAGSFAAAIQGPAVAAGSVFSILQATGATAAVALLPVAPIVGGIIGVGASIVIGNKFW